MAATQAQAYKRAAYPLARCLSQGTPRCFVLHWDNHKQLSRRRDKDDWHEAFGTRYPSGTVTLENGMFWRNMSEMETAYRAMGDFRVSWCDEQEDEHA